MSSEVWLNGQPPVGCECEYSWGQHADWYKIKVLAIGETHLFIRHNDVSRTEGHEGTLRINEIKFRPLKTKEQTEREEAINNVCNDLGIMLGTSYDRIDAAIDSMLKLGYHNGPKVNELSDEEIEVFLKGRASLLSPPYKIEAAKWAIDYILDKEE